MRTHIFGYCFLRSYRARYNIIDGITRRKTNSLRLIIIVTSLVYFFRLVTSGNNNTGRRSPNRRSMCRFLDAKSRTSEAREPRPPVFTAEYTAAVRRARGHNVICPTTTDDAVRSVYSFTYSRLVATKTLRFSFVWSYFLLSSAKIAILHEHWTTLRF